MECPVICHYEELNRVSFQIAASEKKIYRIRSVIELMDSVMRESIGLDIEVTKCQLESVKKERRNFTWDMKGVEDSINAKMGTLREDFLFNYAALLDARDATTIDGGVALLDNQRKREMMQEFESNLDEKLDAYRRDFHLDATTNLHTLKDHLQQKYKHLVEQYEKLFERKQDLTKEQYDLTDQLNPELESLLKVKQKLLSDLEVKDIFTACQIGDLEFIRHEINSKWFKKSFVNLIHPNGFTPLQIAAFHNHLEIVILLLKNGADLEVRDKNGYLAIHWAAKRGAFPIVKCFLDLDKKKKLINDRGEYGRTPLHMSVHNGRMKVTHLLLEQGADINAQTESGDHCLTPLHEAVNMRNFNMVQLLTSYFSLNIMLTDENGRTPLYYAVSDGEIQIIEFLLKHPSFSHPKDPSDPNSIENLLKLPSKNGQEEVCKAILLNYPLKQEIEGLDSVNIKKINGIGEKGKKNEVEETGKEKEVEKKEKEKEKEKEEGNTRILEKKD